MRRITYGLQETKYDHSQYSMNAAVGVKNQFISLLNDIPYGTGPNQRIGNKIFVRYVSGMILIEGVAANMIAHSMNTRTFVVKAIGINNGTLVLSEFQTEFAIGTGYVTSKRNPTYMGNYKVLLDKILPVMPISATQCGPSYAIPFFIPINETFTYDRQGVGNADSSAMTQNDLYVITAVTHDNCCNMGVSFTVAYKDA